GTGGGSTGGGAGAGGGTGTGGGSVQCNVPGDCPGNDTTCQARTCISNTCGFAYQPTTTTCPAGYCDGAGRCVQCNTTAQCPGSDTDCSARSCILNTCMIFLADAGTVAATQTSGDCRQAQCDG